MIFGSSAIAIIFGLVLCALKYLGTINISWVLATAPFWIFFVFDLILIIWSFIEMLFDKGEE